MMARTRASAKGRSDPSDPVLFAALSMHLYIEHVAARQRWACKRGHSRPALVESAHTC